MESPRVKGLGPLHLKNLSFTYPDGTEPVIAELNLEIPAGRCWALKAESGSGKSTMLKIIAGLLSPQSGQYFIGDQEVMSMSFDEFLPYRLAMGYSFDQAGLLNNQTLKENLLLPLRYHRLWSWAQSENKVDEMLKRFDLWIVRDQRPSAVSGRQRKLTVLLRSLVHEPELLLLDEPTSGLKEDSLKNFFSLVAERFESGSLKQIIYASEHPWLAKEWNPKELYMGTDTKVRNVV